MNQHQAILNKIKKLSWDSREAYLRDNSDGQFLSSYKIYDSLKPPTDWLAIAEKCSNNPNHEHYGKEPEMILELWQTKRDVKAKEGNTLDDYIELALKKRQSADFLTFKQNELDLGNHSLVAKTNSFDKLYEKVLKNLSYVGSELWLTCDIGLNLRCDGMFAIHDTERNIFHAIVAEWKSLDKVSMENDWNKLQGPLAGFDDCDQVKFTLQTHLYRFVLERYGCFDKILTPIYNFNTMNYLLIPEAFPYDEKLILDCINYAKNQTTS